MADAQSNSNDPRHFAHPTCDEKHHPEYTLAYTNDIEPWSERVARGIGVTITARAIQVRYGLDGNVGVFEMTDDEADGLIEALTKLRAMRADYKRVPTDDDDDRAAARGYTQPFMPVAQPTLPDIISLLQQMGVGVSVRTEQVTPRDDGPVN